MSDSVRPHRWQPPRLSHPWDSPGKNTGVGCHFLLQCMKVKSESEVAQSCLTLSDPVDCSLPGSFIHGIFQARILEWGAIAFLEKLASNTQKTLTLPNLSGGISLLHFQCTHYFCSLLLISSLLSAILCFWKFFPTHIWMATTQ